MSFTDLYIMPSVNVADDFIAVFFEADGKRADLLFKFNSETMYKHVSFKSKKAEVDTMIRSVYPCL